MKLMYCVGVPGWVAQLFEHLTLDFSSGHDLTVSSLISASCSALTAWSLFGITSLLLSLSFSPTQCALSLSPSLKRGK